MLFRSQKYGEEIDKRFNPIFGEQNSLILTNIQLETDRKKLLDLITDANAGVPRGVQVRQGDRAAHRGGVRRRGAQAADRRAQAGL